MQYRFRSQFPSITVGKHRFSNHCCTVKTQDEADELYANTYFGTEFWKDDPHEFDPAAASSQSTNENTTPNGEEKEGSGSEEGDTDPSSSEEESKKSGRHQKSGKRKT